MALGMFLTGCLVGALAATFLTHAEQSLGSESIPLSLSDAFAQIHSGWTRPTQLALVVLHHPLVMCSTLLFVLACRRVLRSITRQLWVHAPSVPKALLELHASVLGAAVVAVLALGAGLVLLLGQPLSVGRNGLLQAECSVSQARRWQYLVSWASAANDDAASASPLAAAPRAPSSLAAIGRSSLAAFASLWPHPILVGLLVQSLLPLLVHPALVPRWLEALAQHGRRVVGLGGLGARRSHNDAKRFLAASLLRKAFRVGYGAVLLLSVLWSLPLAFELSVVWWQQEVLLHLDQDQDGIITLSELLSPARAAAAAALCDSSERLRAERAASAGLKWRPLGTQEAQEPVAECLHPLTSTTRQQPRSARYRSLGCSAACSKHSTFKSATTTETWGASLGAKNAPRATARAHGSVTSCSALLRMTRSLLLACRAGGWGCTNSRAGFARTFACTSARCAGSWSLRPLTYSGTRSRSRWLAAAAGGGCCCPRSSSPCRRLAITSASSR